MGILEHHQHRLARREALELPPKRRQRCLLALRRAQFRQGVALARRQRQKVGQNRDRMYRINAGLHEQGFELGKLFGGRVAALEAGGSFELTDERKQRTVGVMRRAVVAQPDMWFGLQPLLKRKRNVRLADARLSGQHHDTTFALRGFVPATQRKSSGSRRAESAVEPARSQIITVTWRRSASSRNTGLVAVLVGAGATPSSSAIARRSLRRCPSRTPSSLRSCSVRSRMTERSMALSANRWAYSLRPIDASHSAMPFMSLPVDLRAIAACAPRAATPERCRAA